MKINKILSVLTLGALLFTGACSEDYDDRFNKLEQQLQDVIGKVEGAAELSSAIAVLETQIGALKGAVDGLPDAVDLTLTTGLDGLQANIDALQAELAALGDSQATAEQLEDAIEGLTSDLDLLRDELDTLVENGNVFTGDLIIIDEATLAAALLLGNKVAIVSGNVYVDARELTASEVNKVTSLIGAVQRKVAIYTNKELDFSKLTSVGEDYIVYGNDVKDDALAIVGDDMELAYSGAYSFPKLTVVVDEIILGVNTGATATMKITGLDFLALTSAGSIKTNDAYSFTNVLSANVSDNTVRSLNTGLNFPDAISVIFGNVPVQHLEAAVATNVELHYTGVLKSFNEDYALFVFAPKASAVTVLAKETDGDNSDILILTLDIFASGADLFEELNTVVASEGLPEDWDSSINLPNLSKVDSDLWLGSKTLSLPVLKGTEDDITFLQDIINLPELVSSASISFYEPTSIDLGSIKKADAFFSFDKLQTLNMHRQAVIIDNSWFSGDKNILPELTSMTILGDTELELDDYVSVYLKKGGSTNLAGRFPKLTNLTFGGTLGKVYIGDGWFPSFREGSEVGLPELKNVTTIGNIAAFAISDNDKLTSLSLGHEHISGGAGSRLSIVNNDLLTTVTTTKLDFIAALSVTGNAALTSVDFSSMKSLLKIFDGTNDDIEISIFGNKIAGKVTPDVPITGTSAYQNKIIESASIYSLKPLLDALVAFAAANDMEVYELYDAFQFRFALDAADNPTTPEVESDKVNLSFSNEDFFYIWTDTTNRIEGIVESEIEGWNP